jgi:hypothetical protein
LAIARDAPAEKHIQDLMYEAYGSLRDFLGQTTIARRQTLPTLSVGASPYRQDGFACRRSDVRSSTLEELHCLFMFCRRRPRCKGAEIAPLAGLLSVHAARPPRHQVRRFRSRARIARLPRDAAKNSEYRFPRDWFN